MQKLLRFSDLKAKGVVNNRPTLSRWIKDRSFPPGIKLGENTRVWFEEEVEAWIEAQRGPEAQPEPGPEAA